MRKSVRTILSLVAALSISQHFVFAQNLGDEPTPDTGKTAHATIISCSDSSIQLGSAVLHERASNEGVKLVDIRIEIDTEEIAPGKHAVHIHETSVCTPCGDAKGHFDPGPNSNTSPDGNHPFHMGDLANIEIDDKGSGTLQVTTSRITLSEGPLSVFDEDGSSFIIHVNPDTYCSEGQKPGCAGGARAACGVIERIE